jgi:phosphohistidine phosphatase SixA
MSAPGISRRHRRPFMAPIWLAAIAALGAAGVGVGVLKSMATTTVILVRHAEKQIGTIADPPLSLEGEARADRLAALLGAKLDGMPISAIHASEARRTQQTAAPLARRLGLAAQTRPAKDVDGLVAALRDAPTGSASVVVGHRNTVPEIIGELTHRKVAVSIAEDEFGAIFIVTASTFGPPSVVRLQY